MTPTELFLWIFGIPFVLIQAYWTFAPGTGIVDKRGFFDAFPKHFDLNALPLPQSRSPRRREEIADRDSREHALLA